MVGHVMDRRTLLEAALVAGSVAAFAGTASAAMAGQSRSAAVDALIARMTVAEKAGQLHMEAALSFQQNSPDVAKFNPFMPPVSAADAQARFAKQIALIKAGGVGALMTPMDVESLIRSQRAAMASRLKVPLFIAADIIHSERTVFPVPLAEAASFEPDLAQRTARACAVEATRRGLDVTFAPMVDVGRDQRWGRVVEGAGEDVFLSSLFAAARVRGFQGEVGSPDSMLACVKHFAAYGAAESGLDYQGANISERILHEVYLPPFQAAFQAGAILAMASFNTIDGVPSTGNHHLLTDILRGEMGFKGAVVSDFQSESELIAHGQAQDAADAVRLAINAGCDMGMVSGLYPRYLPALLQSGGVSMETLDRAVRRVLYVKEQAGLFDNPFIRMDVNRAKQPAPTAHLDLAREAARKSIVLLRNEGNLLPLRKSGQRIALIGPFARDTQNLYGPWSTFTPEHPPVALDKGIRDAMADETWLDVVDGCAINAPLDGGIDAALSAAQKADVVVLCLGEGQEMSGESSSRAQIVLPPAQQALAQAIGATGKPVVIVLRNGRALALQGAVRDANAIVVTWFLGTQMGHAVADILFGDVSPSGRLPVTFPLDSGQEPYYYARESSGRPDVGGAAARFTSHFLDMPDAPLYPFGHGLTYSRITYGSTRAESVDSRGVWLSCDITNEGDRDVEEVAQVYIHDVASEVVQPVRKLVAIRKFALKSGEHRVLRVWVPLADLGHLGRECKQVAPSGGFLAWIAPSARAGQSASFQIG